MNKRLHVARPVGIFGTGIVLLVVLALVMAAIPQPTMAANPTATSTKKAVSSSTAAPKATKTATPTSKNKKNSGKPSIAASLNNNYLTVEVANFSDYTVYYVRADAGNLRSTSWTRIGRLRTNKNGAATVSYRLPRKYYEINEVTVCLKNTMSDETLCQVAYR